MYSEVGFGRAAAGRGGGSVACIDFCYFCESEAGQNNEEIRLSGGRAVGLSASSLALLALCHVPLCGSGREAPPGGLWRRGAEREGWRP